jgi:septal ring factor EnvC (AmiA/AmiB activator)
VKANGLIFGVLLIVAILIGFVCHLKQEAQQIAKNLETERYSRLVAEEKVVNTVSKIKQLESDLKSSEEKIAKVQAVLKDQKTLNSDLEKQYDRLSKAKSDLENQLKAVVTPSPAPVQTAQTTTQDITVAQAN